MKMKLFKMSLVMIGVQVMTMGVVQAQDSMKVEPAFEAPKGLLFNEADYLSGKSALSQFDHVIVINKAIRTKTSTTGQTIRMFSHGVEVTLPKTNISTGKEDVEKVKGVAKLIRRWGWAKGTTTSHWRHTTKGFYSVKRVEGANYQSGESSFHMPYAVFFNDVNGLALHEVPWEFSAEGHGLLGQRASSGCVRVHKDTIPGINKAVRDSGKGLVPVINTKTGLQEKNADGTLKTNKDGWRTIVIVQEVENDEDLKATQAIKDGLVPQ
jgi:L,D-transpeptidase catalytic domain